MNLTKRIILAMVFVAMATSFAFPQEMSKEEWQRQIAQMTAQRDSLKTVLTALQNDNANLKKQDDEKAAAVKKCSDELAALISNQEGPFEELLTKTENLINDLTKLSDQDLWARRADVDTAQSWLDAAKQNPLSAVQKYASRIQDDQAKLDALKKTLQSTAEAARAGQTYTVGTWARDRDCLWNIAKKNKDLQQRLPLAENLAGQS